jgi:hypothetical protein
MTEAFSPRWGPLHRPYSTSPSPAEANMAAHGAPAVNARLSRNGLSSEPIGPRPPTGGELRPCASL